MGVAYRHIKPDNILFDSHVEHASMIFYNVTTTFLFNSQFLLFLDVRVISYSQVLATLLPSFTADPHIWSANRAYYSDLLSCLYYSC